MDLLFYCLKILRLTQSELPITFKLEENEYDSMMKSNEIHNNQINSVLFHL